MRYEKLQILPLIAKQSHHEGQRAKDMDRFWGLNEFISGGHDVKQDVNQRDCSHVYKLNFSLVERRVSGPVMRPPVPRVIRDSNKKRGTGKDGLFEVGAPLSNRVKWDSICVPEISDCFCACESSALENNTVTHSTIYSAYCAI